MRFRDALRFLWREGRPGVELLRIRELQRRVHIRRQTSDLRCLEKVFLGLEYDLPLDRPPRTILDAGANIGMATLYFAHKFPAARIVAVEPEASNFALLEKNCSGLVAVQLRQAALWPNSEQLVVRDNTSEKWAFQVRAPLLADCMATSVETVTMPELLDLLGGEGVDLLKLDVEGAELELFSQGTESWIGMVRTLVVELHDWMRPGCAQAFYSALGGRGFSQVIVGENLFIRFTDRD